MDTNKFTAADGSGNTAIAGTLGVTGATALNGGLTMDTNKFTVADGSGNTAIAGTLDVTGDTTVTGATALNGGLTMDTNKFTVADGSGNTAIAGTLGVVGHTALNGGFAVDSAFTVTDATGNTYIGGNTAMAGHLSLNGGLNMDTNKFIVTDTTGNTAIAGTLSVGANVALTGSDMFIGVSGSDMDVTHFGTMQVNGALVSDYLLLDGYTLSSTCALAVCGNGNIVLTPAGSGTVNIASAAITGGSIDGTSIGATTTSTGKFTTVGIGGSTSGSYKLYVHGQAYASSGWATSSDRTLKENILPLGGGQSMLDKVVDLKPISFTYSHGAVGHDNHTHFGFLAQDFETVLPDLVRTDADTGLKSIMYDEVTAVLAGALKELASQVQDLADQVNSMRTQISDVST